MSNFFSNFLDEFLKVLILPIDIVQNDVILRQKPLLLIVIIQELENHDRVENNTYGRIINSLSNLYHYRGNNTRDTLLFNGSEFLFVRFAAILF